MNLDPLMPPDSVRRADARHADRLHTLRTLVIGVVTMWVVVVAAWAFREVAGQRAFADQRAAVESARGKLAGIEELGGVFNDVNTAVEPSVVKIDVVRSATPARGFNPAAPQANSGSGVIVETDGNAAWIVTNNHVVENARQIVVSLADGRRVPGSVVGNDPPTDLAVVRIDADRLIPAGWGDSDELRKGDWVLAFGSPFGFVGSMTSGIVSALNRTQADGILTPAGEQAYQNFIQVDAAINPGNSGGPLVNIRGDVVGINTAIFTRTGDFSGIGFAIPSNQARRVYTDLRERGRVVRGWLGIQGRNTDELGTPAVRRRLGLEEAPGVAVWRVFTDTPADAAGLQPFDVVVAIDGQPVADMRMLSLRTAFAVPGQRLVFRVVRDGQTLDVPVEVGQRPEGQLDLFAAERVTLPAYGMAVRDLTAEDRLPPQLLGGSIAVVETVAPGSSAATAGVAPGDLVQRIEGVQIASAADVAVVLGRLGEEAIEVEIDRPTPRGIRRGTVQLAPRPDRP